MQSVQLYETQIDRRDQGRLTGLIFYHSEVDTISLAYDRSLTLIHLITKSYLTCNVTYHMKTLGIFLEWVGILVINFNFIILQHYDHNHSPYSRTSHNIYNNFISNFEFLFWTESFYSWLDTSVLPSYALYTVEPCLVLSGMRQTHCQIGYNKLTPTQYVAMTSHISHTVVG